MSKNKIRLHVKFSDKAVDNWCIKGVWVSPGPRLKGILIVNNDKGSIDIPIGKTGGLAIGVVGYGDGKKDIPLDLAPFYIKVNSDTYSNYSIAKKQHKWKIRLAKRQWFFIQFFSKIFAYFRPDWMEPVCAPDSANENTNVTIGDEEDC